MPTRIRQRTTREVRAHSKDHPQYRRLTLR